MDLSDIAKQSQSPKNDKKPSIKKEKKEQSNIKKPVDGEDGDYEKMLSISLIEGMNNFLYGCYVTYSKLNDNNILNGEEFLEEFKNIPELKTDEKKKRYLKKQCKIGDFLYWYLYEF